MKHLNNVQWSFRNFSQYTFLNIKIPGSYRSWEDRNVVGQNKLLPIRSILPTNFLVASYKNKILPKEKIWGIFNSYNIQISMLKYLAYVVENGNPYKADDEILFDIPRWMSKADWITLKETKIQ